MGKEDNNSDVSSFNFNNYTPMSYPNNFFGNNSSNSIFSDFLPNYNNPLRLSNNMMRNFFDNGQDNSGMNTGTSNWDYFDKDKIFNTNPFNQNNSANQDGLLNLVSHIGENWPQATFPYFQWVDFLACKILFNIYATRLGFSDVTLRMWHGYYFGRPGGEIGFYNAETKKMIKGSELKEKYGLENIKVQLYSGTKLITESNKLTGWDFACNYDYPIKDRSEYLTLIGIITFDNGINALAWAKEVEKSKEATYTVRIWGKYEERPQGEKYIYNVGKPIDISVDGSNVIITWGSKNVRENQ